MFVNFASILVRIVVLQISVLPAISTIRGFITHLLHFALVLMAILMMVVISLALLVPMTVLLVQMPIPASLVRLPGLSIM